MASDQTEASQRCKHCRVVLPKASGAGRPRQYCSPACKQRDWVNRQRADELKLSDDEIIVLRTALDSLQDDIYVLGCAIKDIELDGALDQSADQQIVIEALKWLLEAAKPVVSSERFGGLRP